MILLSLLLLQQTKQSAFCSDACRRVNTDNERKTVNVVQSDRLRGEAERASGAGGGFAHFVDSRCPTGTILQSRKLLL